MFDSGGNKVFQILPNGTLLVKKSGYPDTQIDAGSGTSSYSYVIGNSGSNFFAKNGNTGSLVYFGTNPTTIIQNAIDNGNGIIFIKAGTYGLSTTLNLDKSNETITGEGDSTLLKPNSGTNLLKIMAINANDVSIKNLRIDGNVANNPTSKHGIGWTSGIRFKIDHVTIVNTGFDGINLDQSSSTNMYGDIGSSNLREIGEFGIFVQHGNYMNIHDNTLINASRLCPSQCQTLAIKNSTNGIVHANTVIGDYNGTVVTNRFGILISKQSSNIVVDNNIVKNVADDGISNQNVDLVSVVSNTIDGASVGISVSTSRGVTVADNVIKNTHSGIALDTVVYNPLNNNSTGITVANNIVTNNTKYGIWVEGHGTGSNLTLDRYVKNVTIRGNIMAFNNQYGLFIDDGAVLRNITATGNVLYGNTLQNINNTALNKVTKGILVYGNQGDKSDNDLILSGQANTYANGTRQSCIPSATNACMNIGIIGANPTNPITGDLWITSNDGVMHYRTSGGAKTLLNAEINQQIAANKTWNGFGNKVTGAFDFTSGKLTIGSSKFIIRNPATTFATTIVNSATNQNNTWTIQNPFGTADTFAGLNETQIWLQKQTFTNSASNSGFNLQTTSAYFTNPKQGDLGIAGAVLKFNDNTNTTQTVGILSQNQTYTGKITISPAVVQAQLNLNWLSSTPTTSAGDFWFDTVTAFPAYTTSTNSKRTFVNVESTQSISGKKTFTTSSTSAILAVTTRSSDVTSPRQNDIRIIGSAIYINDNTNTTRILEQPNTNVTNGGNRTGIASATPVMHGLNTIISTQQVGKIYVSVTSGWASPSATSTGCRLTVQYGTGNPPSAGGALTGTLAFNPQQIDSAVAGDEIPMNLGGWITGLSTNTKYWVDISESNISGATGTCDVDRPSLSLTGY